MFLHGTGLPRFGATDRGVVMGMVATGGACLGATTSGPTAAGRPG